MNYHPLSIANRQLAKLFFFLTSLLLIGCSRPTKKVVERNEFITERLVKTTPVKDQGHSQLCWLYGFLATVESEHLMSGDSVNLSVDYLARRILAEETRRYYLSGGQTDISLRGMPLMAQHALTQYGAVPYDAYCNQKPVNYDVLMRKLMRIAGTYPTLSTFIEQSNALMDNEIGAEPQHVYMLGMEYTPLQFGESVCKPDEYVGLTSFTHHPFGRTFVLEVPDNRTRDAFLNVPIGQLTNLIEAALSAGHAVCWEGDMSEPGFSFEDGKADIVPRSVCTQAARQRLFERRKTTDDHVMELIGLARDHQGRRWFIAKNSWGTHNRYGGWMYLSREYVYLKTVAVYLRREAVSKLQPHLLNLAD